MNSGESKDEKPLHRVTVADADSDLDFRDKDEALRLVGLERTAVFSEEYYTKLKRKLVSASPSWRAPRTLMLAIQQDFVIPPLCTAVYFTQYM